MTRGMRHLDLAELLIKEKVDAKEIKLLKEIGRASCRERVCTLV